MISQDAIMIQGVYTGFYLLNHIIIIRQSIRKKKMMSVLDICSQDTYIF